MNLKILLMYLFVSLFSVYANDNPDTVQKQLLTVHIATWNVNGKKPQEDITKLLGQDVEKKENLPDIVIIGLQEVPMKPVKAVANSVLNDDWSQKIEGQLTKKSKNSYFKADSHALSGITQHIYVKQRHAQSINDIKATTIKTSKTGSKDERGGVIAKFQLYKQWYCIVNAHFHSHDEGLTARITDYQTINNKRVEFCNISSAFVFWLGDLNFRLEKLDDKKEVNDTDDILKFIDQKQYKSLLERDQLILNMASGKIFNDFKEQEITFAPTFQFKTGSSEYNKERRPAWTDRVLFKSDSGKTITPTLYISMDNYKRSDHIPVKAQFQIAGK